MIWSRQRIAILLILLMLPIVGLVFIFARNSNNEIKPSKAGLVDEGALPQDSDIEDDDNDYDNDDDSDGDLLPEAVKAIYLTSWSASEEGRIEYAINLARKTEINALVIDVKDWSGYVAYNIMLPEAIKYNAKKIKIPDIDSLIQRLHQKGIYLIARISIFQDPVLAWARPDLAIQSKSGLTISGLWLDNLGLAWIDPAAKEAWDYNIAIAKDVLKHGFDELNFDYIRFPSDGNLGDMSFPFWDGTTPRHQIIKEFFKYLRQELPDARLSVDLFGLTTCASNDLGVGQIIEDAYEYFDYVCPMVYPSHYANGFLGYQNPAIYPYEVVKYSMGNALRRLKVYKSQHPEARAELRPWLQDFDLGAIYDAKMVRTEIEAVYDALGDDFRGFFLWSASNFYTEGALEKE